MERLIRKKSIDKDCIIFIQSFFFRIVLFSFLFTHIKQYRIFKNAFSQSTVKQTIAKEIFMVFK